MVTKLAILLLGCAALLGCGAEGSDSALSVSAPSSTTTTIAVPTTTTTIAPTPPPTADLQTQYQQLLADSERMADEICADPAAPEDLCLAAMNDYNQLLNLDPGYGYEDDPCSYDPMACSGFDEYDEYDWYDEYVEEPDYPDPMDGY